MIRRGTIALCGKKTLGLITSGEPIGVHYSDGTSGQAWIGIHLTDEIAPVGSPWSSRNPVEVSHIDDLLEQAAEAIE